MLPANGDLHLGRPIIPLAGTLPLIAMFLFLLIAVGNFALGFALAVYLRHGPAWADWHGVTESFDSLQTILRSDQRGKRKR